MAQTPTTTNTTQPCAVYQFERATVRVHGTCTNIREETERFLRRVVQARKSKEKK